MSDASRHRMPRVPGIPSIDLPSVSIRPMSEDDRQHMHAVIATTVRTETRKQSVLLVATLVLGTGGLGGLAAYFRPDLSPRINDTFAMARDTRDEVRAIRVEAKADRERYDQRWCIAEGTLCKMNGGPFARRMNCCPAVDFEAQPLGGHLPWKATEEWPR